MNTHNKNHVPIDSANVVGNDENKIPQYKAILISVGASGPIKYIIQKNKPEHIWFFCSADSRKTAEDTLNELKKTINYHPNVRFIEVEQFEELGPCYLELRNKIPGLLKEHKINSKEVLVDYTGGTKTMSVALVLAGIEHFENFSYVGGKQRTNEGTGTVIDGQEKWLYQSNPWKEIAVREVERAKDLWDDFLFDAAANIIEKAAEFVPQKIKYQTIAKVARGMASRHHFNFDAATHFLGEANKTLPPLYDGRSDFGLLELVRSSLKLCDKCRALYHSIEDKFHILRELLDNSLRCEKQHRYEDAAATLYRAMELQVQIWLEEVTNGTFKLGKLNEKDKLPEQLKGKEYCKPKKDGEIKLTFEECIQALNDLGDEWGKRMIPQLTKGSVLRNATEKRNASIRGHGLKPVDEKGFNEMKKTASELFGFDLEKEANPIPPMDVRWFL